LIYDHCAREIEDRVDGVNRIARRGYSGGRRMRREPVPSQFQEAIQRKAEHFDVLLRVLKQVAGDLIIARAAIAQADAILAASGNDG
jgi:hypothetical protein